MYTKIKELIHAKISTVSEVKHIDWYNQQELNTENQKAFKYPAVFIEILDPQSWEDGGNGFQNGTFLVKLHCVVTNLKDGPEDVMDITQKVFLSLHGKTLFDNTEQKAYSSIITRVSSDFPKRYDNMKKGNFTIKFEYFDNTGMDDYTMVTPNDFTINV